MGVNLEDARCAFAANYGKPPLNTCFKKGQSGNPLGRPVKNLAVLLARR
jgi:hypothetical protein